MVGEPLAAELLLCQPVLLDLGAPGAVEYQDARCRGRLEHLEPSLARTLQRAATLLGRHAALLSVTGRAPSRRHTAGARSPWLRV